jgi:homocysteine S-methyltransferase
MRFLECLAGGAFALSEGSIYERLRRNATVRFDPFLSHAALIYDAQFRSVLERVHREYLDVGQRYRLPMLALTDTWRASRERVRQSAFRDRDVNLDNVRFLAGIRRDYGATAAPIFIGGQIGPRGDAYTPEDALSMAAAVDFHTPQLAALAEGGVDVLFASTLPALSEARGIAQAMAARGLPYVVSFVVRASGMLLDGTPLATAIETIDATSPPPAGYGINCVHPSAFEAAMTVLQTGHPALVERVVSFQGNTSARDPKELDGLSELETEKPAVFADLLLRGHARFKTPIVGGCCGTDTSHLESLARAYRARS